MENDSSICSECHQPILPAYYFCPNCGHSLKENPVPVSIPMQIGIYALSIFLPPLGFWPGIKYAIKKYPPVRRVGIIAIVLSILSTALTVWSIFALFQTYLNQFSGLL